MIEEAPGWIAVNHYYGFAATFIYVVYVNAMMRVIVWSKGI